MRLRYFYKRRMKITWIEISLTKMTCKVSTTYLAKHIIKHKINNAILVKTRCHSPRINKLICQPIKSNRILHIKVMHEWMNHRKTASLNLSQIKKMKRSRTFWIGPSSWVKYIAEKAPLLALILHKQQTYANPPCKTINFQVR